MIPLASEFDLIRDGPDMLPKSLVLQVLRDAVPAPRDLLEALVQNEACSFDHHGGCQSHGYLSLEPGQVCPQAQLKSLLGDN